MRKDVTDSAGADADDHLHELRPADRDEGHPGLAGDRLAEQGLARPRRAGEEHAPGDGRAQAAQPLGVLEELDDLGQLLLGLLDAGDVGEAHRRAADIAAGHRTETEPAAGSAPGAAPGAEEHEEGDDEEQDTRGDREQGEQGALAVADLVAGHDREPDDDDQGQGEEHPHQGQDEQPQARVAHGSTLSPAPITRRPVTLPWSACQPVVTGQAAGRWDAGVTARTRVPVQFDPLNPMSPRSPQQQQPSR